MQEADEVEIGSEDGSHSSTESRNNEFFVRTKAASISSIIEPLSINFNTVK